EDFSDGVADKFTPQTGTWTTTSGSGGRYSATPPASDAAVSTRPLAVEPLSYVEYSAAVRANSNGASAGLVFAATDANNFLYAVIVAGSNQVVLGHRSGGAWFVDAVASATISAGNDYTLLVALDKLNVNVVLNNKSVLNFSYNFLVHDGGLGLMARNGAGSFDNLLIRGDDQTYAGGGTPQLAAAPAPAVAPVAPPTGAPLAPVVQAAIDRWSASGTLGAAEVAALRSTPFAISDLPGLMIGQTVSSTIVVDATAAGWGWFVDVTPLDDAEFAGRLAPAELGATASGPASGRMALLTVVMHELGHIVGGDDLPTSDNAHALRTVDLAAGVRRLPAPAAARPYVGTIEVAAAPLPGGVSGGPQAGVAHLQGTQLVAAPARTQAAPVHRALARGTMDAAFAAGVRGGWLAGLLRNVGAWRQVLDQGLVTEVARWSSLRAADNKPGSSAVSERRPQDTNPAPDTGLVDATFAGYAEKGALAPPALSAADCNLASAVGEEFVTEVARLWRVNE